MASFHYSSHAAKKRQIAQRLMAQLTRFNQRTRGGRSAKQYAAAKAKRTALQPPAGGPTNLSITEAAASQIFVEFDLYKVGFLRSF